jgi:hypothetical protein
MSEKESKDYFKKLMNDTQKIINDVDHNSNKVTCEPTEDYSQKNNATNEEAKIDKSRQNLQANMSEGEPKKSKIAIATLKMPDGKEVEIPLPPKVFKSGREGFYAQISAFVYDDEVYGGQIQVWKKTPKKDD